MTVINHNASMDEALDLLEASPCPIAQAFVKKFREEVAPTFQDLDDASMEVVETLKEDKEQLESSLQSQEEENRRLETQITELEKRIGRCGDLLWRFRPDECARQVRNFGAEYEWIEYPDQIRDEYAPDYESVNGAFLLLEDGEVSEVWVLPRGDIYSPRALFERVF